MMMIVVIIIVIIVVNNKHNYKEIGDQIKANKILPPSGYLHSNYIYENYHIIMYKFLQDQKCPFCTPNMERQKIPHSRC